MSDAGVRAAVLLGEREAEQPERSPSAPTTSSGNASSRSRSPAPGATTSSANARTTVRNCSLLVAEVEVHQPDANPSMSRIEPVRSDARLTRTRMPIAGSGCRASAVHASRCPPRRGGRGRAPPARSSGAPSMSTCPVVARHEGALGAALDLGRRRARGIARRTAGRAVGDAARRTSRAEEHPAVAERLEERAVRRRRACSGTPRASSRGPFGRPIVLRPRRGIARPEVRDVEDRALALVRRPPHRLDPHADADVAGPDLAELVQEAAVAGPVQLGSRRAARGRPAAACPMSRGRARTSRRRRSSGTSAHAVGGTEAPFAERAGRHERAAARLADRRAHDPSLGEPVEEPTHRRCRGPTPGARRTRRRPAPGRGAGTPRRTARSPGARVGAVVADAVAAGPPSVPGRRRSPPASGRPTPARRRARASREPGGRRPRRGAARRARRSS